MMSKDTETYHIRTHYGTYLDSEEIEGLLNLKKGSLDKDTTETIVNWVDIDDEVVNDYIREQLEYYKDEVIDELGLEENE